MPLSRPVQHDVGVIVLGPGAVRYGTALIGVACAWAAMVFAWQEQDGPGSGWVVIAVLLLGVGIGGWLTGRALRLGVVCGSDHFVVRGLVWSRRIPFSAIISMPGPDDVTTWPSIAWHRHGRRWSTPVLAFWVSQGRLAAPAQRSAMDAVRRLERHRVERS
ncbi:hypothetical protein [Curtobacterium sp. ISL-83]|uniref:hypothetical protein n=1 Tax=Curtobacterium sp. ISL-83 TaxID=2819145 RepID=UPI001BE4FBE4|nr:hypothetical protein [Curtobacterium sp. ISL-83]MBT2502127.1 hypothetical protein [Curtobacterium sp. ISL-83]